MLAKCVLRNNKFSRTGDCRVHMIFITFLDLSENFSYSICGLANITFQPFIYKKCGGKSRVSSTQLYSWHNANNAG